jgi:hypothetical protein
MRDLASVLLQAERGSADIAHAAGHRLVSEQYGIFAEFGHCSLRSNQWVAWRLRVMHTPTHLGIRPYPPTTNAPSGTPTFAFRSSAHAAAGTASSPMCANETLFAFGSQPPAPTSPTRRRPRAGKSECRHARRRECQCPGCITYCWRRRRHGLVTHGAASRKQNPEWYLCADTSWHAPNTTSSAAR